MEKRESIKAFRGVSELLWWASPNLISYLSKKMRSAIISVWPTYYEYYVAVVNGSLVAPEPISNAGLITSGTISVEVLSNTASRGRAVDTIMASQECRCPRQHAHDTASALCGRP